MAARVLRVALVMPLVAALVPVGSRTASADATYEAWLKHRDTVLRDPALVRYYTFEAVGEGQRVANLKGEPGTLSFGTADGSREPLQVIEGRWPEKKAVHLDRAFLGADPFEVADKSFTVEAWLRTTGPGQIRGDAVPWGGTLLSAGIGYWDGWRLTLLYPDRVLGLEIGRPAPVNALGIGTGPVADGVWHHVAAAWDGKQTRIYVDGLLAAQGDYAGEYTLPQPGAQFRIGYAGFGWGSSKLDVDEVAVYSRALSNREILQHAFFQAPLTDALAARFEAGSQAMVRGDHAAAAAEFTAITRMTDIAEEWVGLARLRLGQALMAAGKSGAGLTELAKIAEAPRLPDSLVGAALAALKGLAQQRAGAPSSVYEMLLKRTDGLTPTEVAQLRVQLARQYAGAGRDAEAKRQFEELLSMESLTGREKLEVLLQAGHAAAQSRDYEGARKQYAAIMSVADAPAQYRSLAQLCTARTYVQRKDWVRAKSAYELVRDLDGVPQSHAWEAEECLREIERLKAGQPARDPAGSRVKMPDRPEPRLELYVAVDGSDTNPGTKARPFATLQRARDALRALRKNGLPAGGVAVIVKPGVYRATETLTLEQDDSGTEQAPIVYRAETKGTVRFTGGTAVKAFQPVTDPAILARLPEEARGKVREADLKAQGITHYGEMPPRGMGRPAAPMLELFFDGKPMQLARWPNGDYMRVTKVIDPGSNEPARDAVFGYEGDRPTRWTQAQDPWLYGYWRFLWADDTLKVAALDAQARQIRTVQTTSYGEIVPGAPFYAINLLEEIDQPGEWYLDREAGKLYFYPPSDPTAAEVQLSMLPEPFVQMEDVSWVTLQGLTFELGRADGIIIKGGEHCLLAGCTVRQIGGTGVTIDGGTNHGALGCDIYTLGRNGTSVKGGDRKTLTPSGHFIENCDIHDFSRLWRTYTPAVSTDGVGTRIAHNRIHASPGHALRIEGNDHLIEFNEIYDVVRETDDQGGLDMWFNPTYRGVVIRYNFWHDIGNDRECGQAGIRLDDAICGVLIYGNVFLRCSRAQFGGVQIHGGKDNIVENNVFAECRYGISFSGWGPARWKEVIEGPEIARKTREEVDITKPPYSTRYPGLARLAAGEGINEVWRNLVYNCGEFLTRDRGIQDLMDNTVTAQDPGFVDAAAMDFELKADSPMLTGGGFRPIPFSEIGLYEDVMRASRPVKRDG